MTLLKRTGILIILLCSTFSWAVPEDRQKQIKSTQDRLTIDANTGNTVLIGNVVIRQGALTIYADKVTLITDELTNELKYMLAEGNPAQFFDTPVADKEPIEVQGATIEFFPIEDSIVTIGNAQIRQAATQATAERIEYDSLTGVMKIESERALNGNDKGEQAELIIQPGTFE